MWALTLSVQLLVADTSQLEIPQPVIQPTYQASIQNFKNYTSSMVLTDSLNPGHQDHIDSLIVETILPYWYGTTWDFNGYSNVPKHGEIACGYFVSTPLKHIGFNWNRYRLAQKDATTIIKKISGDSTKYFWNRTTAEFLQDIKSINNGLYVIGFDNHVGFLYKTSTGTKIIHSAFYGDVCVVSEEADNCPAIDMSNSYVIGRLNSITNLKKLKNKTLIEI